jgi:hypothetical protein
MRGLSRRELLQRASLLAAYPALKVFRQAQGSVEFQRIRLHTAKRAELHDFFAKTLELPVATTGNVLQVQAGRCMLEFVDAAAGTSPYYHFAFNIPENKLAESMDWLRPRCPIFKNPITGQEVYDFVNWNANSFYFLDPAGNILEFIARHTLRNASARRFDARGILSVSEIALVAPALSVLADRLNAELGVLDYPHPNASQEFKPMGDEHGLFILVRTGRSWLRESLRAEVYPVEVNLCGGHEQELTWYGLPYRVQVATAG